MDQEEHEDRHAERDRDQLQKPPDDVAARASRRLRVPTFGPFTRARRLRVVVAERVDDEAVELALVR